LTVIKSTAPVVPVRVFGTFAAFAKHSRFPRPCRVAVKYGPVMNFDQFRAEAQNCSRERLKAIYQQVADEIMAAIAKLEPYADKERFP
jgi:1-acyl-sn-glycerol-3-phosphate acyltransferase